MAVPIQIKLAKISIKIEKTKIQTIRSSLNLSTIDAELLVMNKIRIGPAKTRMEKERV